MKIPEPRKLKSGSWFIQLRLTSPDGKKVSVPVSAPTKKECIRQAELIKAEHRSGKKSVAASDKTLRQAAEEYIDKRSAALSPSTVRGYRAIVKGRFPAQMDKPISSIRDWQAVCNAEAAECSPKTLKNAWGFIKSVLADAGVAVPDVLLPTVVPNEHPWLTPEQVLVFVNAVHGKPCEIAALMALHGLRRSEILAMTWDKVDLKRGTLRVEGAAVIDEQQHLVQKPTNKTATSRRVVPIMIPALSSALNSAGGDGSGLIVTVSPNTLWAQINAVCKAHGLPLVGVHGLRHSFASLAYHLGLSELETMRLGGWADAQTMRKIYTHLSEADKTSSARKIQNFFQNAN